MSRMDIGIWECKREAVDIENLVSAEETYMWVMIQAIIHLSSQGKLATQTSYYDSKALPREKKLVGYIYVQIHVLGLHAAMV